MESDLFFSVRGHDEGSNIQKETLDEYYWHRPMLRVHNEIYTNGPQLSIMTYNMLAPCDRRQYPSPRFSREVILLHEIVRYNPDVICLQELEDPYRWVERLAGFGYNTRIANPNKYHAIAVCHKWDLFQEFHHKSVFFPRVNGSSSGGLFTDHGALFVCLQFKAEFLEGHRSPSKNAIIIGTTHLPSNNVMCAERTRNAATILSTIQKFAKSIRNLNGGPSSFYTFIGGDFNACADDAAYCSLVDKPVRYTRWAHDALIRSVKSGADPRSSAKPPGSGKLRVVSHIEKTPESLKIVAILESLHNKIKLKATSLYSHGYNRVHPKNSQPGTNEPWFSQWGRFNRELLDYIFLVSNWDGRSNTKNDDPSEFSEKTKVRLLALLRMPSHSDMEFVEPALPMMGVNASDHFCMMAEVELL